MTYDEVVNLIILRMGKRTDLRAQVEAELVNVQENVIELERNFRPWFLLQEDWDDLAIASGNDYAELPSDFLAEYEKGFAYLENADGQILAEAMVKWDIDKLRSRFTDSDEVALQGEPTHYALVGSRMYVRPVPDRNVTIKLRMYAKQAKIRPDTAETHPILANASDWLMNQAGAYVAESVQHRDALNLFETRARIARNRVMGETIEREYANAAPVKGGER